MACNACCHGMSGPSCTSVVSGLGNPHVMALTDSSRFMVVNAEEPSRALRDVAMVAIAQLHQVHEMVFGAAGGRAGGSGRILMQASSAHTRPPKQHRGVVAPAFAVMLRGRGHGGLSGCLLWGVGCWAASCMLLRFFHTSMNGHFRGKPKP